MHANKARCAAAFATSEASDGSNASETVGDTEGGDTDGASRKRIRRRRTIRRLPPRSGTGDEAGDHYDDVADASLASVTADAVTAAAGSEALYGSDDLPFDDDDDDDVTAAAPYSASVAGTSVAADDKAATATAAYEDDDDEHVEVIDFIGGLGPNLLLGDPPGHRSGYVAIVGRPNAGKSTLMNQLVGQKLSIVTYKPQTTRHRILGIVSEPEFQMVLLDTPGVMKEEFNKLDEMMLKSVRTAMANADVLLTIVDAVRDPMGSFEGLLPEERNNPAPLGVIINKCDLLDVEEIRELKRYFEGIPGVSKVFPVSALAGIGHQAVQDWALECLPEGPTLYPKDSVSEHPERFFIAEIIREKIFLQYSQEVPYSTQVWVQSHKERDGIKKDLILAKVFVERKSQMGIIIGREGRALKELSTAARLDIENFLSRPVFLDLGVKVKEGWRSDESLLEDLGLDDPNKLEQPMLGPSPDFRA